MTAAAWQSIRQCARVSCTYCVTRVRSVFLAAASAMCLGSHPAIAADPGPVADQPIEEVVVTGSRLGSANTSSPSPIVVLSGDELLHQGTVRTEDLLNSLPQVNSGLTLGANGASVAPLTGTATADLRGIGAFRTLVLVNGRRAAPGDPVNPSADLNTVPSALIKRVEVLTGGASAIYGSDAIAGVVNFILDTDYTGFKLNVEGGLNEFSNDHRDLQSIERASGVSPPTGTVFDGGTIDVSAVFGRDLFGGAGHLTAYAGYRQAQRVAGSSRDTSVCTLAEVGNSYQCQLDATIAGGQFVPPSGALLTLDTANGHAFRPVNGTTDPYNPAPFQDLQRPDTRYNAGLFASYRINPAADLYAEVQYTNDTTTVRYEPTGTSLNGPDPTAFNSYSINCNNPLLAASQYADLGCVNPTDFVSVGIGRRNVEGGLRSDEFQHRSFRGVIGLKGTISEPWSYDASFMYGRVNATETLKNDFSVSRLTNALNVVSVGGTPTCQSVVDLTDRSCVPYNLYAVGGVTPAALGYITGGGQQSGYAERTILTGQLIGDLDHYGLRSPFATNGVGVALGAEYRRESVSYQPDTAYATGDLLVTGGVNPTQGSFHVSEVFAEFKIPLVADRSFAKDLVLKASDRYAQYSPQGNVNAFGVGGEWAPVAPLRLRGSINRSVRAPNNLELYSTQVLGAIGATDPCAGPIVATSPSLTQCALTGVTQAEYGNIAPQTSINVITGGNPNLRPETADTITMGFVLTPQRNVLFSADYWRIKVKSFLGGIPGLFTLNTCLNTGDPFYCGLIHREAVTGSLSAGNGPTAGRVIGTRFNTGSYGNSGVDLEGRYVWDLEGRHAGAGRLTFSFTGSAALKNPINVTPGNAEIDCTGLFGPNCSGAGPTSPVPKWRHRLRVTWEPKGSFELSLNWRHIGGMDSEFTSNNGSLSDPNSVFPIDSRIAAYDYFDLDGSINVASHLTVRAGINNLAGRTPPVVGFTANPLLVNGNAVAGMYDNLGRYLFLALAMKY